MLGLRTKTAQHFDPHRVIEHPLPERFEMLLRQDCGRRKNRNLFPFHHGLERGADRDLGLAKANVAADQAIHRARTFHVGFRRGDGGQLVRRFAKRK